MPNVKQMPHSLKEYKNNPTRHDHAKINAALKRKLKRKLNNFRHWALNRVRKKITTKKNMSRNEWATAIASYYKNQLMPIVNYNDWKESLLRTGSVNKTRNEMKSWYIARKDQLNYETVLSDLMSLQNLESDFNWVAPNFDSVPTTSKSASVPTKSRSRVPTKSRRGANFVTLTAVAPLRPGGNYT